MRAGPEEAGSQGESRAVGYWRQPRGRTGAWGGNNEAGSLQGSGQKSRGLPW